MKVNVLGRFVSGTAVALWAGVGSVMRRALKKAIAAVGVLALFVSLVLACPCAEPVRTAEAHGCCAPPLGVRAPDQMCCSSPGDASLVVSAPSSPIAPPASVAFVPLAEALAVPASLAAGGRRPAHSPPAVLRI
jgi:hypothetical protein